MYFLRSDGESGPNPLMLPKIEKKSSKGANGVQSIYYHDCIKRK